MLKSFNGVVAFLAASGLSLAGSNYSTDFSTPPGAEWSRSDRDTSPSGEIFLGRFTNQDSVALTLANLPPHDTVTISLNLFIIHSWDGVQPSGDDIWRLRLGTGEILLETTFANELSGATNFQNYPDMAGGVLYPARTGASFVNNLGYFDVTPRRFGDATYELVFEVAHSDSTIEIVFEADGWTGTGLPPGLGDESWGIDNVAVSFAIRNCLGDVDGDLVVDFADLNAILGLFGWVEDDFFADLDGSGIVDFGDLNLVLSRFGASCGRQNSWKRNRPHLRGTAERVFRDLGSE